jgi:hypothetical protein
MHALCKRFWYSVRNTISLALRSMSTKYLTFDRIIGTLVDSAVVDVLPEVQILAKAPHGRVCLNERCSARSVRSCLPNTFHLLTRLTLARSF